MTPPVMRQKIRQDGGVFGWEDGDESVNGCSNVLSGAPTGRREVKIDGEQRMIVRDGVDKGGLTGGGEETGYEVQTWSEVSDHAGNMLLELLLNRKRRREAATALTDALAMKRGLHGCARPTERPKIQTGLSVPLRAGRRSPAGFVRMRSSTPTRSSSGSPPPVHRQYRKKLIQKVDSQVMEGVNKSKEFPSRRVEHFSKELERRSCLAEQFVLRHEQGNTLRGSNWESARSSCASSRMPSPRGALGRGLLHNYRRPSYESVSDFDRSSAASDYVSSRDSSVADVTFRGVPPHVSSNAVASDRATNGFLFRFEDIWRFTWEAFSMASKGCDDKHLSKACRRSEDDSKIDLRGFDKPREFFEETFSPENKSGGLGSSGVKVGAMKPLIYLHQTNLGIHNLPWKRKECGSSVNRCLRATFMASKSILRSSWPFGWKLPLFNEALQRPVLLDIGEGLWLKPDVRSARDQSNMLLYDSKKYDLYQDSKGTSLSEPFSGSEIYVLRNNCQESALAWVNVPTCRGYVKVVVLSEEKDDNFVNHGNGPSADVFSKESMAGLNAETAVGHDASFDRKCYLKDGLSCKSEFFKRSQNVNLWEQRIGSMVTALQKKILSTIPLSHITCGWSLKMLDGPRVIDIDEYVQEIGMYAQSLVRRLSKLLVVRCPSRPKEAVDGGNLCGCKCSVCMGGLCGVKVGWSMNSLAFEYEVVKYATTNRRQDIDYTAETTRSRRNGREGWKWVWCSACSSSCRVGSKKILHEALQPCVLTPEGLRATLGHLLFRMRKYVTLSPTSKGYLVNEARRLARLPVADVSNAQSTPYTRELISGEDSTNITQPVPSETVSLNRCLKYEGIEDSFVPAQNSRPSICDNEAGNKTWTIHNIASLWISLEECRDQRRRRSADATALGRGLTKFKEDYMDAESGFSKLALLSTPVSSYSVAANGDGEMDNRNHEEMVGQGIRSEDSEQVVADESSPVDCPPDMQNKSTSVADAAARQLRLLLHAASMEEGKGKPIELACATTVTTPVPGNLTPAWSSDPISVTSSKIPTACCTPSPMIGRNSICARFIPAVRTSARKKRGELRDAALRCMDECDLHMHCDGCTKVASSGVADDVGDASFTPTLSEDCCSRASPRDLRSGSPSAHWHRRSLRKATCGDEGRAINGRRKTENAEDSVVMNACPLIPWWWDHTIRTSTKYRIRTHVKNMNLCNAYMECSSSDNGYSSDESNSSVSSAVSLDSPVHVFPLTNDAAIIDRNDAVVGHSTLGHKGEGEICTQSVLSALQVFTNRFEDTGTPSSGCPVVDMNSILTAARLVDAIDDAFPQHTGVFTDAQLLAKGLVKDEDSRKMAESSMTIRQWNLVHDEPVVLDETELLQNGALVFQRLLNSNVLAFVADLVVEDKDLVLKCLNFFELYVGITSALFARKQMEGQRAVARSSASSIEGNSQIATSDEEKSPLADEFRTYGKLADELVTSTANIGGQPVSPLLDELRNSLPTEDLPNRLNAPVDKNISDRWPELPFTPLLGSLVASSSRSPSSYCVEQVKLRVADFDRAVRRGQLSDFRDVKGLDLQHFGAPVKLRPRRFFGKHRLFARVRRRTQWNSQGGSSSPSRIDSPVGGQASPTTTVSRRHSRSAKGGGRFNHASPVIPAKPSTRLQAKSSTSPALTSSALDRGASRGAALVFTGFHPPSSVWGCMGEHPLLQNSRPHKHRRFSGDNLNADIITMDMFRKITTYRDIGGRSAPRKAAKSLQRKPFPSASGSKHYGHGGRSSDASLPTGVYLDVSRKLWRCQWRENGRFKTKSFPLNQYHSLKDARKACILFRCLMGGWEVNPAWLADEELDGALKSPAEPKMNSGMLSPVISES